MFSEIEKQYGYLQNLLPNLRKFPERSETQNKISIQCSIFQFTPNCDPALAGFAAVQQTLRSVVLWKEKTRIKVKRDGRKKNSKTQLVFVVHVRALAVFLFFKSCLHFIFRGVLISLPSVRLGALCSVRRPFGFVSFRRILRSSSSKIWPPHTSTCQNLRILKKVKHLTQYNS